MIKKILCSGVMTLTVVSPLFADPPKGFEEFRKGLLADFNSFRSRILDHYADFLAGEWHEYEALEGEEKYSSPKLSKMPVIEIDEISEGDNQKKEMLAIYGFTNKDLTSKSNVRQPQFLDWIKNTSNLYNASASEKKQVVEPKTESSDESQGNIGKGDIMTENGLVTDYDGDIFSFYGMKFAFPKVDFDVVTNVNEVNDFSTQWELLDEQKVAEKLIPSIKRIQEKSGLSDYLLYEMIMAYADYKLPQTNDASKMGFTHHILTNMEFGLRIALDNNGQPFMLIPFDEKIYGCSNLPLGGVTYYMFSTPGRQNVQRIGLSTPGLPEDVDLGKPMHLRMDDLHLPYEPVEYSFEHEGLKIEGEMNRNIIPMLYKYPKMDTSGFAASTLSKELRENVVKQIEQQLADDDPLRAADKLLAMIQFAFPYATDDEFHGFEKPYFFEETLFYPKSDCEDRAVFYSYLLWNALGVENDLIAYPNHEATAIKAEKVWGGDMHYVRDGSKFFISDPTFQGAPTGNGMSRYSTTEPVIDLSYSKSE